LPLLRVSKPKKQRKNRVKLPHGLSKTNKKQAHQPHVKPTYKQPHKTAKSKPPEKRVCKQKNRELTEPAGSGNKTKMTPKHSQNLESTNTDLISSLQNDDVTLGLILRGKLVDTKRLTRTLQLEFPDLFLVYQTVSVGKLFIKKGEPQQ
jgi:hypothetical protein